MIVLAYGFLYLSVLALWLPDLGLIKAFYIPAAIACALALYSGLLSGMALLPLVALLIVARFMKRGPRLLMPLIFCMIALGLGAHLFPGFDNLKVVDAVRVSPDGIPFTLHLNFDKTWIGLVVLGELLPLARRASDWKTIGELLITRGPLIILGLALLSIALQFVRWDPKIPEILPIWAITNLLFVCVAEEGFFRGFIQNELQSLGRTPALIIASLLFGIAHFAGGLTYVILASIAGLAYGWMYQKTGRIEASILTHFFLNLTHILLLTYPALAA